MVRILANVDRLIGNSLQFSSDPGSHKEKSDIRSHGLLKRRELDGAVVDLYLKRIDLYFFSMDFFTEPLIAFDQRSQSGLDHRLGKTSHQHKLLKETLNLFVKVTHYPNLPEI